MNAHILSGDILIFQATDFADPETGRIHERDHSFFTYIRESGNEGTDVLLRRDEREISIEPSGRQLSRIPGPVKDIESEETKLRDTAVDGTVREVAGILDEANEITHGIPGSIKGIQTIRIKERQISR